MTTAEWTRQVDSTPPSRPPKLARNHPQSTPSLQTHAREYTPSPPPETHHLESTPLSLFREGTQDSKTQPEQTEQAAAKASQMPSPRRLVGEAGEALSGLDPWFGRCLAAARRCLVRGCLGGGRRTVGPFRGVSWLVSGGSANGLLLAGVLW